MTTRAGTADFGSRLRTARDLRGLTMAELAEKMGLHSRGNISRLESGSNGGLATNPGIATVEALARALDVSPGWLAFGESP